MMAFRWILHLILALRIPLLFLAVVGVCYFVAYRLRLFGLGPRKKIIPSTAEITVVLLVGSVRH